MESKPDTFETIRGNLLRVKERIQRAAISADRHPSEIRLVVVTKTHPTHKIKAVIDAGATDLGENYVEEALPKIQALAEYPSIQWHMIGHVQRRKAQSVIEFFQYVHSVDSLRLAERLSHFALECGKTLPVWMEFNVSGEATKSGMNITSMEHWPDLLPEIEQILLLPGLSCLGLMTVPPFSADPELSRPYYQKLRNFQQFVIDRLHLQGFKELSMGMSSDFEVAIQEGSTCVRIGQAILGPRH